MIINGIQDLCAPELMSSDREKEHNDIVDVFLYMEKEKSIESKRTQFKTTIRSVLAISFLYDIS